MLAHANSCCAGAGERPGTRGKIPDPYLCDIVLSPRGIDLGTVGAHVIKQYLFMRGLLPAPFDELGKLADQQNPVTVLALFGPSCSRPREALEIVFVPVQCQPNELERSEQNQQQRLCSAEAVRKACCKATRKLVPLLSSLPLPKSSGSAKLFIALAGHASNENFRETHDRFISLKQCKAWTVLRVGSMSKASHLQHVYSYLQHRLQRQIKLTGDQPDAAPDDEPGLAFCNATVPSLSFTSDVYV
eukprot:jgi/Ulvmu1/6820/UM031_0024.1